MKRNMLVFVGAALMLFLVFYSWMTSNNFVQTIASYLLLVAMLGMIMPRPSKMIHNMTGWFCFISIFLFATGLFVYVNGSFEHYILRKPQPVKILVTYKGDFVKTLRCSQPTWMIPFYHQVKEFPLSEFGDEYYYPELSPGNYATYDNKKVAYRIQLHYHINIWNAERVYKEFKTTNTDVITGIISRDLSPMIAEATRMFRLEDFVSDDFYQVQVDDVVHHHMSETSLESKPGEPARGWLEQIIIPVTVKSHKG